MDDSQNVNSAEDLSPREASPNTSRNAVRNLMINFENEETTDDELPSMSNSSGTGILKVVFDSDIGEENSDSENELVVCPHKEKGCGFRGTEDELGEHLETCNNILYDCPKGCSEKVSPKKWRDHIEKQCDFAMSFCQYCNNEFQRAELEDHYKECELFEIDCPYNCDIKLPRCQMKQHAKKCPLRPFNCKYTNYGCNVKATQNDLENHEKEAAALHLECVTKWIKRDFGKATQKIVESISYKIVSETKKALDDIQGKIISVSENVERLNSDIRDLKESQNKAKDNVGDMEGKVMSLVEKTSEVKVQMDNLQKLTQKRMDVLTNDLTECRTTIENITPRVTEITDCRDNVACPQTNYETLIEDLHKQSIEVYDQKTRLENFESERGNFESKCQQKISTLENDMIDQKARMDQLNESVQNLILPSNNIPSRSFTWRIENFTELQETRSKDDTEPYELSSQSYNIGGYQFLGCVCPNGVRAAKGKALSCYLVVTKGPMDDCLKWPLECNCVITLVDQYYEGNDRIKDFTVHRTEASPKVFPQPNDHTNFGRGLNEFISFEKLVPHYLVNDTLILNFEVTLL